MSKIQLVTCSHTEVHFSRLNVISYSDFIMGAVVSKITSLTIIYSTVYSGVDQIKHQSSASLAFVWGPVNSPHKGPVTRKMFPFDDVIVMNWNRPLIEVNVVDMAITLHVKTVAWILELCIPSAFFVQMSCDFQLNFTILNLMIDFCRRSTLFTWVVVASLRVLLPR